MRGGALRDSARIRFPVARGGQQHEDEDSPPFTERATAPFALSYGPRAETREARREIKNAILLYAERFGAIAYGARVCDPQQRPGAEGNRAEQSSRKSALAAGHRPALRRYQRLSGGVLGELCTGYSVLYRRAGMRLNHWQRQTSMRQVTYDFDDLLSHRAEAEADVGKSEPTCRMSATKWFDFRMTLTHRYSSVDSMNTQLALEWLKSRSARASGLGLLLITSVLVPRAIAQVAVRIPDVKFEVNRIQELRGDIWVSARSGGYRIKGTNIIQIDTNGHSMGRAVEAGGHIWLFDANAVRKFDGTNATPMQFPSPIFPGPRLMNLHSDGTNVLMETTGGDFFSLEGDRAVPVFTRTSPVTGTRKFGEHLLVMTSHGASWVRPGQSPYFPFTDTLRIQYAIGSEVADTIKVVEPFRRAVVLTESNKTSLIEGTNVTMLSGLPLPVRDAWQLGTNLWLVCRSLSTVSHIAPYEVHRFSGGLHLLTKTNSWDVRIEQVGDQHWLEFSELEGPYWLSEDGDRTLQVLGRDVKPKFFGRSEDHLWLGGNEGLFRKHGQGWVLVDTSGIIDAFTDGSGTNIWVSSKRNLIQIVGSNITSYPLPPYWGAFSFRSWRRDSFGSLPIWDQSPDGISLLQKTNWTTIAWPESGSFFAYRNNGTFWASGTNGLFMLDGQKWTKVTGDDVGNVRVTQINGTWWIWSSRGVFHYHHARFHQVGEAGAEFYSLKGEAWLGTPEGFYSLGATGQKHKLVNGKLAGPPKETTNGLWLSADSGNYLVLGTHAFQLTNAGYALPPQEWLIGNSLLALRQPMLYAMSGTNKVNLFEDARSVEIAGTNAIILAGDKAYVLRGGRKVRLFDEAVKVNQMVRAGGTVWLATSEGAYKILPDVQITSKLEGTANWLSKALKPFLLKTMWVSGNLEAKIDYSPPQKLDPTEARSFQVRVQTIAPDLSDWSRDDFGALTPYQLPLNWGNHEVWVTVKDKWGNAFTRKHEGWVVPGDLLLGLCIPLGWGGLLVTTILLAPFSSFCHRLLMNPFARNIASLWAFPLLVTMVPHIRWHILRRYRKGIAKDATAGNWVGRYVCPGEEFKAANFLGQLEVRKPKILVGPSGSGKSAFVRYLCGDSLSSTIRDCRWPVLLRLNSLEGATVDEVERLFIRELARNGEIKDPDLSKLFLKDGGFLLLLDGLNEVDQQKQRGVVEFARLNSPHNLICIASQTPYAEDKELSTIPMPEFTDEKIREFIRHRLGDKTSALLARLSDATFQLYRNPMELELALELVGSGDCLPDSKLELYGAILQPIFARWEKDGQTSSQGELLAAAFASLHSRNQAISGISGAVQGDLLDNKILIPRGTTVRFRHDLIRAYLAGCYLAGNLNVLNPIECHALDVNWRTTFQFTVLVLAKNAKAREVAFLLVEKNHERAGELFRWMKAEQDHLCRGWESEFEQAYGAARIRAEGF